VTQIDVISLFLNLAHPHVPYSSSHFNRELKFSYLDLYSLSIALPYPIFDKKGIAKYDKALKSLTVTMPVQPPLQPVIESNPSISAVAGKDEVEIEKVELISGDAEKLSSEEVEKEVQRKKSNNSRWVGSEDGKEREEAKKRTDHLTEEIKTKLLETKESSGSYPLSTINPNYTPPGPGPSAPVGPLPTPPSFTPSSAFTGKKEGLVFQKGQHGMGYYADSTHSTPLPPTPHPVPISPTSSATPNAPKTAVTTSTTNNPGSPSKSCPFEYKQTKQAIAVLIQVPDILVDSVTVSFGDSTAEVEFRALGSDSRVSKDDHVNPTISSDPSLARITSINTIANSASGSASASGKEEANTSNQLNSQQNRSTVLYRFVLACSGRLSKSLCKYDVASINMVIVLTKQEEGYWTESEKSPVLVMAECTAGTLRCSSYSASSFIPLFFPFFLSVPLSCNNTMFSPHLVVNIAGTGTGGEGGQRVEAEPTLISLEKPHTQGIEKTQSDDISNLKTDSKGKDLADELKKMKFSTRPDFELD
jgi:PIH1 CS-like domain